MSKKYNSFSGLILTHERYVIESSEAVGGMVQILNSVCDRINAKGITAKDLLVMHVCLIW